MVLEGTNRVGLLSYLASWPAVFEPSTLPQPFIAPSDRSDSRR